MDLDIEGASTATGEGIDLHVFLCRLERGWDAVETRVEALDGVAGVGLSDDRRGLVADEAERTVENLRAETGEIREPVRDRDVQSH